MLNLSSSGLPDQLQALLKEQTPLLQVLLEMMDGVLICDSSARILMFNKSLKNLLGLMDSALQQPCAEAIPGEDLQMSIQSVLQTGESVSEELTMTCNNLEKIFQIHVVPLTGADSGEVTGCVAVFHDITDIKITEKMRRDFVANVSHELRTPLSAIKGYAETLLEGALEDGDVSRDFVNVIHNHSLRLSRLVEDLLDLSKLESPDFRPELKPVSIEPVIARVQTMVMSNLGGKKIEFSTNIPDNLPKVWANVGNMEQVLTNLLDNAVKYTPENGKVSVSATERTFGRDSYIQVNVADTGIGIERKHIPRLFERFYRVDKARSRDLGGTGLGLSIVKHIIQYHGGEIWVESKVNKGSTFSFTLKTAPEE